MDRGVFLHLINTAGNQTLSADIRWQSIKHICLEGDRSIANFQQKVTNNEVIFVDNAITAGGETTRITGFYILEALTPDVSFLNQNKYLSFVGCDTIEGVTFEQDPNNPVTDLTAFYTKNYSGS